MSSTSVEPLQAFLRTGKNASAVEMLEKRMRTGQATESEILLCGVLLMLPPLGDYLAASKVFSTPLTFRSREAAAWEAYRFSLWPETPPALEELLHRDVHSAIAAQMSSVLARARGDFTQAIVLNRQSRKLRPFPFNLIGAIKHDTDLRDFERAALWSTASDLIVSRTAGTDVLPQTVEGALQFRWENLILGTRITNQLWEDYAARFGKA